MENFEDKYLGAPDLWVYYGVDTIYVVNPNEVPEFMKDKVYEINEKVDKLLNEYHGYTELCRKVEKYNMDLKNLYYENLNYKNI